MDASILEYARLGFAAAFGDAAFILFGIGISFNLLMVLGGFVLGIVVGAIPGLTGPFAMAVSLPILLSYFGFSASALLPVLGFLVGIMKGATLGGAVPAILFKTPGTPDAYMTTLDGYPMTRKGQSVKALRVAHFSCASGDTFSDFVLITSAPFLAVLVERYLGYPEKAAMIVLSLSFIAAVVSDSVLKGLISTALGMLIATIGTGEDSTPRLTFGFDELAEGVTITAAVLGVLIIGEIFVSIEDMARQHQNKVAAESVPQNHDSSLTWRERRGLMWYIFPSAVIGTVVGALPGIGSTLAATLGYTSAQRRYKGAVPFGQGAPEGVAATEAANSSVSGANLIPLLSLGIPGNVAAVFIVVAIDTIGGLNPGPSIFRMPATGINPELVLVIGLFALMMAGNLMNWLFGGHLMRGMGLLRHVPNSVLMPLVLLMCLTAVYVQEGRMFAIYSALVFGLLGYLMRRLGISVLPFVIAFILADDFERLIRQAYSVSGADPWFFFRSPLATAMLVLAAVVAIALAWPRRGNRVSAESRTAEPGQSGAS